VTGAVDERIDKAQDRVGVPPAAAATVNAAFKDSSVRFELHVGTNSKLVYLYKVSTTGPNINVTATYAFDYETPVSITVPR
jgi:hypothetical protein